MDNYSVVYSAISSRSDGYTVTNELARHLQKNPYITVGSFMRSLNDEELKHLIAVGDTIKKDGLHSNSDIHHAKEFVLIGSMLVQGEGLDIPINEDTIPQIARRLFAFLNIEYLSRNGLVAVDYNGMSFDPDMDDKIIARKIL